MNINPKVTASVAAAAVTTLIAWVASLLGLELPPEVQGALTTVIVAVSGYLTPASDGKHEA